MRTMPELGCTPLPYNTRDATLADFSHEVGHSCLHCQAIRDEGPSEPCNPLVRLIASAMGTTASETKPRVDKRSLRNEARKARKAGKRYKALLLAIKAA